MSSATVRGLDFAGVCIVLISTIDRRLVDVTIFWRRSSVVSDADSLVCSRRMSALVRQLGAVRVLIGVARRRGIGIRPGLLEGPPIVGLSVSIRVHWLTAMFWRILEMWLCWSATVMVILLVAISGLRRRSTIICWRRRRYAVRWASSVGRVNTFTEVAVVALLGVGCIV